MRKFAVDYREFRLGKLNDSRFAHLKLLFGWVVYLVFYLLTERIIPAEKCFSVHCGLDDLVPFNEWFVIPYVGWYFLIVFSLVYALLFDIEGFKGLQTYIITTQLIATVIYIIFPTRQDLRPTEFARDNLLTAGVRLLYLTDTNTGVCPSLHVAISIGIASFWLKDKSATVLIKLLIVIIVVLICLSTAFIKQHSVLDFFAALPVCFIAEVIAFRWLYKNKTVKNK